MTQSLEFLHCKVAAQRFTYNVAASDAFLTACTIERSCQVPGKTNRYSSSNSHYVRQSNTGADPLQRKLTARAAA